MSVRVHITMSKIMRTPVKVGICTYAAYASWQTLLPPSNAILKTLLLLLLVFLFFTLPFLFQTL